MSVVGDRIKEMRLKNKMTQTDVANRLGVGKQAIYKYETGAVTNIPLDNLVAMASIFGTTPGYLAGWSDNGRPSSENRSLTSASNELSDDESHLLDVYRKASPESRKNALLILESSASERDSLMEEPDLSVLA